MHNDVDPVFIVSTGRTGTKFLATFLASHYPNVEAHHTTPWSTAINIASNAYLARLLSKRVLLGIWEALKGDRYAYTDKDIFVDSNNHLYAFATVARELYPGLKVVHVVRDPRTYVRSHINWSRQRAKSLIANYCVPFWQPSPRWAAQSDGARPGLSKFEHFCWVWTFKNELMAKLQGTAHDYLCIRFEDFVHPKKAGETLAKIAEFIGLQPIVAATAEVQQAVNSTTRQGFPRWQKWSAYRCARLDEYCGLTMKKYRYGREPEWRSKVALGRQKFGILDL